MAFNGLTDAQAERLALLLEELGEAQQAIGKILRHGYDSYNPDVFAGTTCGPSNRMALARELGDVEAAIRMLTDAGDMDAEQISMRVYEKARKVRKYLHHQPE